MNLDPRRKYANLDTPTEQFRNEQVPSKDDTLNNPASLWVRQTLLYPSYWLHRSEVAQPLFCKLEFIFFLAWLDISLHRQMLCDQA